MERGEGRDCASCHLDGSFATGSVLEASDLALLVPAALQFSELLQHPFREVPFWHKLLNWV